MYVCIYVCMYVCVHVCMHVCIHVNVCAEIYGKVRNGLKPYFRPTLEEYDCPCDELAHVIRRCWAEDPSDRPDFTQLKTIIRKLNR